MSITTTNSAILRKTATGAFYTSLAARAANLNIARFLSVDSTTAINKDYGWYGALPLPREWTGARNHVALKSYTDTITPKKWELTIDVDAETMEDDQTGQLSNVAGALGVKAAEHMAKRFTEVLEAGVAGSIDTAYDGQFFFDGDHAESGTNQDNDFTSAAATGTDPTASEMETAVGDAIEAMTAFTDDQGNPHDPSNNGFVVMIPPSFLAAAHTVMGPNGSLGGAAALTADATGVTGIFRGTEYVVNPYLAAADSIYILRPGMPGGVGPFIAVNRVPWRFDTFTPADSQQANENDVATYAARARYEIGYGDWRAASVHIFS